MTETRAEYTTSTDDQPVPIRDLRTEKRFFVDNVILRGYGPTLGVYGIAVYTALCMHANLHTQECYPSHRTMADMLGCSVGKVKDSIRLLEVLRLIETAPRYDAESKRQTSNLYTLLNPPVPPVTTDTRPRYREVTTNNPHVFDQSCLKEEPPPADSPSAGELFGPPPETAPQEPPEQRLARMRDELGTDPLSVASVVEQKRAQVEHPDYGDPSKDVDPWLDRPVKEWCAFIRLPYSEQSPGRVRMLAADLRKIGTTDGLSKTPQEVGEAIRVMTTSPSCEWMRSAGRPTHREFTNVLTNVLCGQTLPEGGNGRHDRTGGGEPAKVYQPGEVTFLSPEETEEAMREFIEQNPDLPIVQGHRMGGNRPKKRRRLVSVRDESIVCG
jgi:hypothetical protein